MAVGFQALLLASKLGVLVTAFTVESCIEARKRRTEHTKRTAEVSCKGMYAILTKLVFNTTKHSKLCSKIGDVCKA